MKSPVFKWGYVVALLAFWLMTGCTTDRDWNHRVGRYTYDQAIGQMGQPAKLVESRDGVRMGEWLIQKGDRGSVGYGMGANFVTPGYHERPVPRVVEPRLDEYMRLSFNSSGELTAWKRVYR